MSLATSFCCMPQKEHLGILPASPDFVIAFLPGA
jgi:hypothetical protein